MRLWEFHKTSRLQLLIIIISLKMAYANFCTMKEWQFKQRDQQRLITLTQWIEKLVYLQARIHNQQISNNPKKKTSGNI